MWNTKQLFSTLRYLRIPATKVVFTALLSLSGIVQAQPENPYHHISYEVLTEHLILLPENTHPRSLNILDQYSLIPIRDSAVVNEYADTEGYTWKVLEHKHDEATHEWMRKRAKTVMDSRGIRAYDAEERCVHSADKMQTDTTEAMEEAQRADVLALGIGLDSEMMQQPTEAEIAAIRTAGGDVVQLPNGKLRWYFDDGGWEDTDFQHLYTESVSLMDDGTPKTVVTLYRYAPEIGTNSVVPTEEIAWYNTQLSGGVCAQRVVRTSWANYQVHLRKGSTIEIPVADSSLLAGVLIQPNPVTGDILYCHAPETILSQSFEMLITDAMGNVYRRVQHSANTPIAISIAGIGTSTYSLCLLLPTFPAIRFFLKQ